MRRLYWLRLERPRENIPCGTSPVHVWGWPCPSLFPVFGVPSHAHRPTGIITVVRYPRTLDLVCCLSLIIILCFCVCLWISHRTSISSHLFLLVRHCLFHLSERQTNPHAAQSSIFPDPRRLQTIHCILSPSLAVLHACTVLYLIAYHTSAAHCNPSICDS